MLPPELPPLPALTRAEGELVDRYLDVLDLLGRINPCRAGDTYRGLRAAQALVGKAAALRDALTLMHERGESELHAATLARALRVLDGERRAGRVTVPPGPGGGRPGLLRAAGRPRTVAERSPRGTRPRRCAGRSPVAPGRPQPPRRPGGRCAGRLATRASRAAREPGAPGAAGRH
jgi:hypothetical protein